jgi:translation initiation factor 6
MRLKRTNINNTPYLGVSSFCSKDFCIVPTNILKKEEKILNDFLNTKIIKTSINQSSLIGVYTIGINNKLVIGDNSITSKEMDVLEKEGINVKIIKDYNALGNLLAINSNYGIASPLLSDSTVKEISKFLNVNIEKKKCVGMDISGSSIFVNDNLFIVNPNIEKKEYNYLSKKFKVPGIASTLNYGNSFVGNDAIGNDNALLLGSLTSNVELRTIDSLIVDL